MSLQSADEPADAKAVLPLLRTADASLWSQVYITQELAHRQPKRTDWNRATLALRNLAARASENPQQVLPALVDLAMEITGGSTAGLSLYEKEPAPGIFRWHYLRGKLAPFDGGITPRNYSPCGITLDQAAPVLVQHPERIYDWLVEAEIGLPEVLLVPLFLGGPEPLGTLWIVSDDEGHFDTAHARVASELASFVGIALRMKRNKERLRASARAHTTLARDMSRRLENLSRSGGD
jgi:GAF domain-containing protein